MINFKGIAFNAAINHSENTYWGSTGGLEISLVAPQYIQI